MLLPCLAALLLPIHLDILLALCSLLCYLLLMWLWLGQVQQLPVCPLHLLILPIHIQQQSSQIVPLQHVELLHLRTHIYPDLPPNLSALNGEGSVLFDKLLNKLGVGCVMGGDELSEVLLEVEILILTKQAILYYILLMDRRVYFYLFYWYCSLSDWQAQVISWRQASAVLAQTCWASSLMVSSYRRYCIICRFLLFHYRRYRLTVIKSSSVNSLCLRCRSLSVSYFISFQFSPYSTRLPYYPTICYGLTCCWLLYSISSYSLISSSYSLISSSYSLICSSKRLKQSLLLLYNPSYIDFNSVLICQSYSCIYNSQSLWILRKISFQM